MCQCTAKILFRIFSPVELKETVGLLGSQCVYLQYHAQGLPTGIAEFLYSFKINEIND